MKKVLCFFLVIVSSCLSVAKADHRGDVIAISQCVYDIYVQVDDQKLRDIITPLGISKGGYKRIDSEELNVFLQKLPPISKQHAGGAAANTLAGISALGGKTTFVGVVGDDVFGQSYLEDTSKSNVQLECVVKKSQEGGDGTGLVIVLIAPDGERTFISYLGVSIPVDQKLVNLESINKHQILFSEAYVWDKDITAEMLHQTYIQARQNRIMTAFSLANASVVKMYREALLNFMKHVDILFGNLEEYQTLFDAESIETIIQKLQKTTTMAIITNAQQGALIVTSEAVFHTPAKAVRQIVDTTGAGDTFAAGFLYGITHGYDLEQCGRLGNEMAGHVITQLGTRLTSLTPEIRAFMAE